MTTSPSQSSDAFPRPSLRLVGVERDRDVDDAALVRGLVAREEWAVRAFWKRYAPMVYGILDRALGSPSESEDLTQDVLWSLFKGVGKLRDITALRSFVVACTVLKLRQHLRWKRVRRFLTLSDTGAVPEQPTQDGDGHGRELLRGLYRMLDTLSADDRTAFVLRKIEGFSLQEVAECTGASLATAKRRIRRASLAVEEFARADPDLATYLTKNSDDDGGEP